jgi:hypothetical protein
MDREQVLLRVSGFGALPSCSSLGYVTFGRLTELSLTLSDLRVCSSREPVPTCAFATSQQSQVTQQVGEEKGGLARSQLRSSRNASHATSRTSERRRGRMHRHARLLDRITETDFGFQRRAGCLQSGNLPCCGCRMGCLRLRSFFFNFLAAACRHFGSTFKACGNWAVPR